MGETQQEGASLLKMFICAALWEINMFYFEVLFVIWKPSNKTKIFQFNILIKKLHFANIVLHLIKKVKVKFYY